MNNDRGVLVHFDFSNWPAGCPSTVHFFKLSCRAASYSLVFQTVLPGGLVQLTSRPRPIDPATGLGCLRQPRPVAGSIGLGRLVNWTRPPGRTVWKTKLYSAARQDSLKKWTVLGHTAGQFEKSNCTRTPRGRTVYLDFWPSPPPSGSYGLCIAMGT